MRELGMPKAAKSSLAEQLAEQRTHLLALRGHELARLLGGERLSRDRYGREGASVPDFGHSAKDRSLEVRIDPRQRDGLFVKPWAPGGDWKRSKDHVLGLLGFPAWQAGAVSLAPRSKARAQAELAANSNGPAAPERNERKANVAQRLWAKSKPAAGTPVEAYLDAVRGGLKPTDTLRFLPPVPPQYPHPAMIVPIGLGFIEPEPGRLIMPTEAVVGVHLTYLLPDGSGKADTEPVRRRIGQDTLGKPIPLAPMDDTLGLAVTEGVEDGLTVHWARGVGVWVAGGTTCMPALADGVPDYTSCVTVFMHPEPPAIEYAARLVRRLVERGIYAELQSTTQLQTLHARGAA
jgi:hypothetical protein